MRMLLLNLLVLCFIIVFSSSAFAFSFSILGGSALSFPTPLTIYQDGYETIKIDSAQWETRPFYEAPYYSIRFTFGLWSIELIHHKLYLISEHPDIQQFWITHGYNLILLERLIQKDSWFYSLGAGVVVAHPETIVRGQELSDPPHAEISFTGYYFSGIAGHASIGYKIKLLSHISFIVETKLTAAWARVPIANGHADVPNIAIHGIFGVETNW
ncbi:MAG: hypothetical protein CBR30_08940 [Dictyoglomus sp. NZ13-RE01]|nr:MAG: hypothetical protein CBR30_08940 [Dictyoglomus sp. NZ13-RE01]